MICSIWLWSDSKVLKPNQTKINWFALIFKLLDFFLSQNQIKLTKKVLIDQFGRFDAPSIFLLFYLLLIVGQIQCLIPKI